MLRNSKSTWQKNNLRCHVCIRQHPPKKKTLHKKKVCKKKYQSPLSKPHRLVHFSADPPAQQQLEALRSPLQKLPPPIVAGAVARDLPSRIGRGKAPDFLAEGSGTKTAASCVSSLAAPFAPWIRNKKNVVKDGDSVRFSNQFNRDKVLYGCWGE